MSDPDYAELERLARAAAEYEPPWDLVTAELAPAARRYVMALDPATVLRLLARRAPGDRGIVRYLRAARTRRSLARALGGNPEAGFDAYLSMATAALVKMADEQEAWDRALAADSRPATSQLPPSNAKSLEDRAADSRPEQPRCPCTVDAELNAGPACPACGHRDHGRSGCGALLRVPDSRPEQPRP